MKITEELMVEYALGELDAAQMAAFEAALANDPSLCEQFAELADAFAFLGDGLEPIAPSNDRRAALIAAVEPVPRLPGLVASLARFLDVAAERARGYLEQMNDVAAWAPAPFPGLDFIHVAGGPALAVPNADIGLIRMAGGLAFPYHVHNERESVLILQGGARFSDGTTALAGDEVTMGPGSGHSFDSLPGADLIYAVILIGGQTFVEPPTG